MPPFGPSRASSLSMPAALAEAIDQHHRPSLKLLLDRGADPEAVDSRGHTALMRGARVDAWNCVEEILARAPRLDARSACGETSLLVAARHGHVRSLLLIAKAHRRQEQRRILGYAGAVLADGAGHGADWLASHDNSGQGVVSLAAASGSLACLEAAVEMGARIETSKGSGAYAVAMALTHNAIDRVAATRALIPLLDEKLAERAVRMVCEQNSPDVFADQDALHELLDAFPSSAATLDDEGRTPLMRALFRYWEASEGATARALIPSSDVWARDSKGRDCLDLAVEHASFDESVMEPLIERLVQTAPSREAVISALDRAERQAHGDLALASAALAAISPRLLSLRESSALEAVGAPKTKASEAVTAFRPRL